MRDEGARFDVVLEGTPFVDLTFSFDQLECLPGLGQEIYADQFAMNPGSTLNTASVMAGLGLEVGLFAALGNDIFSRFVDERMRQIGLSDEFVARFDEPLPLISAGISTPHDRLFISYAAPRLQQIERPHITEAILERYRPRIVLMWHPLDVHLCERARRLGSLLIMDTFWNVEHLRSQELRDALSLVDIVTPNLPEALEMTGASTAEAALDVLSQWCRCVVIKMGGRGCIARRDGVDYAVPSIPVQTRDTTGAGESFDAGLIYGLLRGYPFETCLLCANISGGLSTQVLGGSGNRVTAAELESWLSRQSPQDRHSPHIDIETGHVPS